LDNEATLAGVLAHEVAHAERRHATKRLTKAYGVDFLLGLVLGTDPNATAEIAAGILTNVAFMQNSQADEFEADEYAFKYLQTSKWYPGGIKLFFNKINENGGSSSNFLEKLLSTHPMPEERIQKVDEMIKESNLPPASESNIFTDKYQQFKKSL
jgi:predicted Zn-dependent protease